MHREPTDAARPPRTTLIKRHGVVTRITHWINAACLGILLMSGLQIFNAWPSLYWGEIGADRDPAWLTIGADHAGAHPRGFVRVGGATLPTTGVLGLSKVAGAPTERAFPTWATLPALQELAAGRRWHLFVAWCLVANGLVYLVAGIASGHLRRDVLPTRADLRARHLWQEIVDHARLRFAKGNAARRYNALQKLTYLAVIAVLLPAMVLTGLDDVAGRRRCGPLAARPVRRAPVGALDPFYLRVPAAAVHRGPSRHGAAVGRLEQHALDDHRTLRHRQRGHAMNAPVTRRRFLAGAGALLLSGCDSANQDGTIGAILRSAEPLTMAAQRLLQGRRALAREFTEADLSPSFRVNGTSRPDSDAYAALVENQFADWRLKIDGLVARPQALSLAALKLLPARTQITRHDCVEGWSAIGKWTGVPLGALLRTAGVLPSARYVVFHCADELEKTLDGSGRYYESIDLVDAFHPQTLLAYGMNGQDLSVGHGAPLRPARRAPARLQAGQVPDAHRAGRQFQDAVGREWRVLGRPRV